MYKKLKDRKYDQKDGSVKTIVATEIQRKSDGACIPFDPENTDYQVYLKWVDEGGITEEADD